MKGVVAAVLAMGAWVSAPAEPLTPTLIDELPQWRWERPALPGARLTLDLIRADVTVIPVRTDRIAIEVKATGRIDDARRVGIDVAATDEGWTIADRFPIRSAWAFIPECLPANDPRGDYWLVSTRLAVTVHVPEGMPLTIGVREGTVVDRRAIP